MSELSIKVIDKNGKTRFVASGDNEVVLVNTAEYQEGDRISLETGEKNIYVWFQADDALGASLVYITDNISFDIPFGEKRISYSPKAFMGSSHYLCARIAREDELRSYRNLALNVYDQHGDTHCYPHRTRMSRQGASRCLRREMPSTALWRTCRMESGLMSRGVLTEIPMRR